MSCLGGDSFVATVQASDLGNRYNRPVEREHLDHNGRLETRILLERPDPSGSSPCI